MIALSCRAARLGRRAARVMLTCMIAGHPGWSTPASAQQPAAGTPAAIVLPPLSVRTPRYEVYASDSASLQTTRSDVEYAIAQVTRYFGETPVPLAVVVYDSSTGSVSLDDEPFRARGFRALPWMSDAALERLRAQRNGEACPARGAPAHGYARLAGRPTIYHRRITD